MNHLKKLDYKELKSLVEEKKNEGVRALAKMNRIQQRAVEGHEENLLKQHRLIWRHEYQRLKEAENHLAADLNTYFNEKLQDLCNDDDYDRDDDKLDVDDSSLEKDFSDFMKLTLEPIKDLM